MSESEGSEEDKTFVWVWNNVLIPGSIPKVKIQSEQPTEGRYEKFAELEGNIDTTMIEQYVANYLSKGSPKLARQVVDLARKSPKRKR